MAELEGRLTPEEEPIVTPVLQRLPADWRVQLVRGGGPIWEVRVVIPDAGTHTKTMGPNADGHDIARFLEWVLANPKPTA